jgi:divalent metal cation (Fe/Co/Zn/Cd) transporter
MDLSRLMRPPALIERDVRRVLSEPHHLFAPHLVGVSHFTCHWVAQQLTIQLELAFQGDLTISQAGTVAREIEEAILQQVKDVDKVDVHMELTAEHIENTKQQRPKPTLELTQTVTKA